MVDKFPAENKPVIADHCLKSGLAEEINFTVKCILKWNQNGVAWNEIALLTTANYQGKELADRLKRANIPFTLLDSKPSKTAYNPTIDQVTIMTIHSSKGLEFPRAVLLGMGFMGEKEERKQQDARLLYVAMTRAQECLLMTTSHENEFYRKITSIT